MSRAAPWVLAAWACVAGVGATLAQDGAGGAIQPMAPGAMAPGPGPQVMGPNGPGAQPGGAGPQVMESREPDPEQAIEHIVSNPKLAQELGLTDDQVAKVKKALYEFKQKQIELKAQLELAGLEQARLMTEKDLDEKALMAAVEKTGAVHTEMAKQRVKGMIALRQILGPEQMEKIQARIREHMRERLQHGGGQGLGPRVGTGEGPLMRRGMGGAGGGGPRGGMGPQGGGQGPQQAPGAPSQQPMPQAPQPGLPPLQMQPPQPMGPPQG